MKKSHIDVDESCLQTLINAPTWHLFIGLALKLVLFFNGWVTAIYKEQQPNGCC